MISATDGGVKESTTIVVVSIEDFNDNAPVFNPSTYTASVLENVGVGHKLGVVKATDKDSGPRGRITYSITNGNVGSVFRCSADGKSSWSIYRFKKFQIQNNLTPVLHLYIRFKPRLKRLETAIKESVHKHSITGFPLLTQRAKQPS